MMLTAMHNNNSPLPRRGWSLIELAVVTTFMGILAGVTLPRFMNALERSSVDAAARRVADDLEYLRMQARKLNSNVTVSSNPAAASYSAAGVRALDSSRTTYTVSLAGDPYQSRIASVSFDADAAANLEDQSVIFSRSGSPDSSGSVIVRSGSLQK